MEVFGEGEKLPNTPITEEGNATSTPITQRAIPEKPPPGGVP